MEPEVAFSDSAEQESFTEFLLDFQKFSVPLLQKTCCLPELSPPPVPANPAADGKVTRGCIRSGVAILEQEKKTKKKGNDHDDNHLLGNRIANDGD